MAEKLDQVLEALTKVLYNQSVINKNVQAMHKELKEVKSKVKASAENDFQTGIDLQKISMKLDILFNK